MQPTRAAVASVRLHARVRRLREREAAERHGSGTAMIGHFRHLSREELNALPSAYPDLGDEVAHFYVCEACGQVIDVRRLGKCCIMKPRTTRLSRCNDALKT